MYRSFQRASRTNEGPFVKTRVKLQIQKEVLVDIFVFKCKKLELPRFLSFSLTVAEGCRCEIGKYNNANYAENLLLSKLVLVHLSTQGTNNELSPQGGGGRGVEGF